MVLVLQIYLISGKKTYLCKIIGENKSKPVSNTH